VALSGRSAAHRSRKLDRLAQTAQAGTEADLWQAITSFTHEGSCRCPRFTFPTEAKTKTMASLSKGRFTH
jgi:hypothetical protein